MSRARRYLVRPLRVVVGLVLMTSVLLLAGTGAARADKPTVINEDNTGFACEYFPAGEPQVNVSINYDAVSGEGSSRTDVLTADGESHVASGSTDEVTVGDGVVSARYPLTGPDGSAHGEVVLQGTYVVAAEPITLRNRFPYAGNAKILGTLVYTPLEVTWTTFQVGPYDVSGVTCFGQRSQTTNRVLQPHRLVDTFRELRVLGSCTAGPLTRFDVVGSEVGVSIELAVPGLVGSTNLALADGSDTQAVEWYAEGGEEPAAITSLTVTLTENGRSRSLVEATPDGLILERTQPLSLVYELVLPGGAGTVSNTCAAESVLTRVAVEPVD